MMDLLQITNDPALARRCDALPGMRLFVDLETHGKAVRQAGRNSFISTHQPEDVGRIKAQLQRARLMVRVNPLHPGTSAELDTVLAQGADSVMLPMFQTPDELHAFSRIVAGRAPIVALLETAGALHSVNGWIGTPGLSEVFVGLNDLHLSLGFQFMFEPLAQELLDSVAHQARAHGLRFGFGGIARLDEGLLPGRDVLAEHMRLGSQAVILSRTFHRPDAPGAAVQPFEAEVAALRQAEQALATRTPSQVAADRLRISGVIGSVAALMARRAVEGAA
ncbi:aldolase/citrate lyase family protein [Acidovorax radicis]|jgi:2-keto-3-deoxy-L-rhamnonate aldolase RhmA|uniref:aldolase/citrate lyase family protein n=1 Tax=Acidovorax radicis TaxID=758826 RepID=UPI001CFBB7AB|nr:aldolase/citrate lyase family protein [Acidovorax radicis]UCV00541.1 aldolase [Acidovorax radicis]